MKLSLCLAATLALLSVVAAQNNRPIIGILTQPTHGSMAKYGGQYIAASYVKYIESAGARVVPIMYNSSVEELTHMFNSLNGFLFPGGGADIAPGSQLYKTGQLLYTLSRKSFDAGVPVPIVGHCMGFELLCYITSEDPNILEQFDAEDIAMPLNFTSLASSSRLFSQAPQNIINALTREATTMNNHMFGVSPARFEGNAKLASFYNILSTNVDRKGLEFVSTIESKKYPVYGLQWHPEKNNFEWMYPSQIPHSADAVLVAQYMANFAVAQARANSHSFKTPEEEQRALIYNYKPVFTGMLPSSSFQQCYFW